MWLVVIEVDRNDERVFLSISNILSSTPRIRSVAGVFPRILVVKLPAVALRIDGHPRLLYDKWTGEIDKEVVDYWRENYDLRSMLERDWATLGPKLVGKIHITMGTMDTYFLDEATRLLEEFLESTTDLYYAGSFEWGERQPHCFSGTPEFPGQTARQRVLPKMLDRMLSTAPPGADTVSWRYEGR